MILADFGTSYTKLLDLTAPDTAPRILPTKDLPRGMTVDLATGHNAKRFGREYVNELIALARGAETLVPESSYLILDCGSRDGTDSLMTSWGELPGFRYLSMDGPVRLEAAFEAGILAARGDAVILLDPALPHTPELIPNMIMQWESDARLVYATRDSQGGSVLRHWDEARTAEATAHADMQLPPECMGLGLLDRRLVDWLVQAG